MAERNLTSGWITYEIFEKDSDGNPTINSFSLALAASGSIPTQAVKKMRMAQDLGWPEAKRSLKDDRGRPLIVKKDDVIWLLKCKPKCWRLYFYVYEKAEDRRIVYVYAVCKKANKEDPNDAIKARRIADTLRRGGSAIRAFKFPSG
jgi:hypothetical protein